ncbi:MAG: acetoacetate decarboxylase family protein [Nitrososphaerales archaeon]|nr:acetoacetate decarboxylase family protein [Nitrososphaerales archaeon]
MSGHPLVPSDHSAIEPGPWHYGADYVSVYFRASADRLRSLIPEPFRLEEGDCIAYGCEIVSVSDSKRSMVSTRPDRTLYREAAVGVRCSFAGRPGVYFPVMWVTTEWALLRGLLNGYQKRLADSIAITKLHPLNPGLAPIGPGSELSAFCMKGPENVLSLRAIVRRKGEPKDLQSFGATYGMRMFPRTDESQGAVAEAVEISKSNSRVSDVWLGDGSLETPLDLGKTRVTGGAVYRSGFTISGSRVLAKT